MAPACDGTSSSNTTPATTACPSRASSLEDVFSPAVVASLASPQKKHTEVNFAPPAEDASAFEARYNLRKRVLGTGANGSVLEAEDRRTRRRVAVKCHRKAEMGEKQLQHMRSEVEIHSSLTHPRIVKLMGVYETETTVRMVMEELRGGELFDRVLRHGPFSEAEVAKISVQVLHAVMYLHDHRIVHRDIKLENLMYDDSKRRAVKLIDFGFAARVDAAEPLSKKCGTIGYAAPEVFAGKGYDEKVDIWSVGSVVYVMLTAKPLYSGGEPRMLKKNRAGLVDFCGHFRSLPEDAQSFVRSLLTVDPFHRPSAQEALRHPWLRRLAPKEVAIAERDIAGEAKDSVMEAVQDADNTNSTKSDTSCRQGMMDVTCDAAPPLNLLASC